MSGSVISFNSIPDARHVFLDRSGSNAEPSPTYVDGVAISEASMISDLGDQESTLGYVHPECEKHMAVKLAVG
ncbi:Hypothetical predicted protein, partial [Pelobates cultripes]